MKNKITEEVMNTEIDILNLDTTIYERLRNNNINTLGKLCSNTRKELRSLNFIQNDIQVIVAKLQLEGLDIKGNVY